VNYRLSNEKNLWKNPARQFRKQIALRKYKGSPGEIRK
jgi:hypothetical protein